MDKTYFEHVLCLLPALTAIGNISEGTSPFLRGVLKLARLFQAFTTSKVSNDKSTSFWYDVWIKDEALNIFFPDLHALATNQMLSIANFLSKIGRAHV